MKFCDKIIVTMDKNFINNFTRFNETIINKAQKGIRVTGSDASFPENTRQKLSELGSLFLKQGIEKPQNIEGKKLSIEELLNLLILKDSALGEPSETAVKRLANVLSPVDINVMNVIQKAGTKIVVVKEGQSLLDTGIIKQVDTGNINKNAEEDSKTASEIIDKYEKIIQEKINEKRNEKKKDNNNQKGEVGDFGDIFGGMLKKEDPSIEESMIKLENYGKMADEIYAKTGKRAMVYKPFGVDLTKSEKRAQEELETKKSGGDLISSKGSEILKSLNDIAKERGARTPEEIKEFIDILKKFNGERINKAQQEYFKDNPNARKPQNLDDIPMDIFKNPIIVPDLCYYRNRSKEGKSPPQNGVKVSMHDFIALHTWHDDNGKVKPRGESTYAGQFFPAGDNKDPYILIREDSIFNLDPTVGIFSFGTSTPIHESGHAYEDAMKKQNPEAYRKFCEKREKKYWEFKMTEAGGNKFVSGYAKTNPLEFFAESFSMYFENPKFLKSLDEEWFNIVEGFIKQAGRAA